MSADQLALDFAAPNRLPASPAEALVRGTLLAALPPGVPPSFRAIQAARFEGRGRDQQLFADLEMVDGLPATVRLRKWAMGWSHQFINMPGGPLSFEEGRWVRRPEDLEDRHHAAA